MFGTLSPPPMGIVKVGPPVEPNPSRAENTMPTGPCTAGTDRPRGIYEPAAAVFAPSHSGFRAFSRIHPPTSFSTSGSTVVSIFSYSSTPPVSHC